MRISLLAASLPLALGLAACSSEAPPSAEPAAAAPAATEAPAAVATTSAPSSHSFEAAITPGDYAEHVRVLASDEFEGRAPGSPGEKKTIEYLQKEFERLGLQPGNNGSWFQTVPMVATTTDPSASLGFKVGETEIKPAYATQMVIGTRTGAPESNLADSEVVFVGYGVNAPELGWNDYAGLDVKGKTVVMLINDPGFHTDDESLFEGKRMTYYGRWTYKFEEAARQGAALAIIVHDDAGAAYPWEVVQNGWTGAQFDLPVSVDPEPRLPLQGWISGPSAEQLFSAAGQDFSALRTAASQRGFTAVPLNATASAAVKSSVREGKSENVLAMLPGAQQAEEAVVYMAHWDHLGRSFQPGADQIYNGAIDNATGVAGVLEIAEKFATGPKPARSLLFLIVTLEESGLLGSKYYVGNPVIPLHKTVATINLDAMSVIGRTRDFTVVGFGSSELEDILRPIAESQSRVLQPESAPQGGFYFRSDHFNFAKAGVPSLYAKGGVDHVEKGEEHGKALAADYTANRYHKPGDEFDPNWDLAGVMEDLEALYGVGNQLVTSEAWPNWYPTSAFKAAREASLEAGNASALPKHAQ
jgi:Zn-dependent M28 family amino/carboxypeptidase